MKKVEKKVYGEVHRFPFIKIDKMIVTKQPCLRNAFSK